MEEEEEWCATLEVVNLLLASKFRGEVGSSEWSEILFQVNGVFQEATSA